SMREPCGEKRIALEQKEAAVIGRDHRQLVRRQPHDRRIARDPSAAPALVTDVAMREDEARLPIVVLLRDDTIESDRTRSCAFDRSVPEGDSVTFAAKRRLHDVEA